MTGHVAEIAGHHPETAGHVRPKYAATLKQAPETSPRNMARSAALNLALSGSLWLAVFAGFFFCEGRFYRDAYLATYGLYPPMFPWDRSEMVYFGVNVGIGVLAPAMFLAIVGATYAVVSILGISALIKRWRGTSPGVHRQERPTASASAKQPLPPGQLIVFSSILVIASALLLALIYAGIGAYVASRGASKARHEIAMQDGCNLNALVSDDFVFVKIVRSVQGIRERYDGFLITCSTANCAVRNAATGLIQVVPRDSMLRFDTAPKSEAYLPNN